MIKILFIRILFTHTDVVQVRYNQIVEQITYMNCDVILEFKIVQSINEFIATFCYRIFSQSMNVKKHDRIHVGVMSEKYLGVKRSSSDFQSVGNSGLDRSLSVARESLGVPVTMQSGWGPRYRISDKTRITRF